MSQALQFLDELDEAPPHIGMAPLVDIVLLLICFYLFVMQSIQSHAEDAVNLPQMFNEQAVEIIPAAVVVNLDADGRLRVNGRDVAEAQLAPLLEAERARAKQAGQKLDVVVRADRTLRYEQLDGVLSACREAGLGSVLVRSTRELVR